MLTGCCEKIFSTAAANVAAQTIISCLKVHKNENFFGSDFEFCTIVSYAQILTVGKNFFFDRATIGGDTIIPLSLRLS